ncbi:ATP synthase subunit delta, mitochondrial [Hondaea fermentalgiana]|uniref:ATP synthase subunit delta, mitochondrial n=1 Tax=Hondaea fermentalgiana TaxID=2315210 RepID=A0A2R5G451_9STRA|nr:ATP synthase subunit delta, mitochondrial [Hondaea fermentalgiana]|eukprot:GBG25770.1 ATP synthase subunit delta, mitochondrial [Hondaea fermentalgiana]
MLSLSLLVLVLVLVLLVLVLVLVLSWDPLRQGATYSIAFPPVPGIRTPLAHPMMQRVVSGVAARRVGAKLGARALHASPTVRMMAEPEAAGSTSVNLTLASATKPVKSKEPVFLVNVPGMTGEFGVAAEHAPVLSELKPGVVQVTKAEGDAPESFFVSGGLASVHEDSSMDVSAAEIFSLDELDGSVAQKLYTEAKRKLDGAAEGSQEQAVAQIEVDVYEGVCVALGISV